MTHIFFFLTNRTEAAQGSSSLGEMCTHVATLLHAVISAHEVQTNTTEEKCAWIDNTSKQVIKTFDSIIMSLLNKH
jgi:hypothetical protein